MAESEITEDVASSEDSTKGIHNPINESSKTQEASEKKQKLLNGTQIWSFLKKFETSADVEPQLKKSERSGKAESWGFLSKSQDPEAASPAPRMVRIISQSENNWIQPGGCSSVECMSMYCVKELQREGSELSFEELRARCYFTKCRQQEEQQQ